VQLERQVQLEPVLYGTLLVLTVWVPHTQLAILQHMTEKLGIGLTLTVATLEILQQRERSGH
jgi:hypothetical protein